MLTRMKRLIFFALGKHHLTRRTKTGFIGGVLNGRGENKLRTTLPTAFSANHSRAPPLRHFTPLTLASTFATRHSTIEKEVIYYTTINSYLLLLNQHFKGVLKAADKLS
jgi:hypothetical protein